MRESGGISICPCGWSVSIYRFNHPHALAFFDFDKDNFFNCCSFLDQLKNETKKTLETGERHGLQIVPA